MDEQRDQELQAAARDTASNSTAESTATDSTTTSTGEPSDERIAELEALLRAGQDALIERLNSPDVQLADVVAAGRAIELTGGQYPPQDSELGRALAQSEQVAQQNFENELIQKLQTETDPAKLTSTILGLERNRQITGMGDTPLSPAVNNAVNAASDRLVAMGGDGAGRANASPVLDRPGAGVGDDLATGSGATDASPSPDLSSPPLVDVAGDASNGTTSAGAAPGGTGSTSGSSPSGETPANSGAAATPTSPASSGWKSGSVTGDASSMSVGWTPATAQDANGATYDAWEWRDGSTYRDYGSDDPRNGYYDPEGNKTTAPSSSDERSSSDDGTNAAVGTTDDDTSGGAPSDSSDSGDTSASGDTSSGDTDTATAMPTDDQGGIGFQDALGLEQLDAENRLGAYEVRQASATHTTNNPEDAPAYESAQFITPPGGLVTDPTEAGDAGAAQLTTAARLGSTPVADPTNPAVADDYVAVGPLGPIAPGGGVMEQAGESASPSLGTQAGPGEPSAPPPVGGATLRSNVSGPTDSLSDSAGSGSTGNSASDTYELRDEAPLDAAVLDAAHQVVTEEATGAAAGAPVTTNPDASAAVDLPYAVDVPSVAPDGTSIDGGLTDPTGAAIGGNSVGDTVQAGAARLGGDALAGTRLDPLGLMDDAQAPAGTSSTAPGIDPMRADRESLYSGDAGDGGYQDSVTDQVINSLGGLLSYATDDALNVRSGPQGVSYTVDAGDKGWIEVTVAPDQAKPTDDETLTTADGVDGTSPNQNYLDEVLTEQSGTVHTTNNAEDSDAAAVPSNFRPREDLVRDPAETATVEQTTLTQVARLGESPDKDPSDPRFADDTIVTGGGSPVGGGSGGDTGVTATTSYAIQDDSASTSGEAGTGAGTPRSVGSATVHTTEPGGSDASNGQPEPERPAGAMVDTPRGNDDTSAADARDILPSDDVLTMPASASGPTDHTEHQRRDATPVAGSPHDGTAPIETTSEAPMSLDVVGETAIDAIDDRADSSRVGGHRSDPAVVDQPADEGHQLHHPGRGDSVSDDTDTILDGHPAADDHGQNEVAQAESDGQTDSPLVPSNDTDVSDPGDDGDIDSGHVDGDPGDDT